MADNYPHKTASGEVLLSCAGIEYYRVRTSSGEVLPFDGCIEGHKRVLPRLGQLPQ